MTPVRARTLVLAALACVSAAPGLTPDTQLEANQPNTRFGISVASAGDVNGDGYDDVIVGAYRYDAGEADEGGAFVFLGGPGGIDATPDTVLEGNQPAARFGRSVAGAGDVDHDGYADVIVGAYEYDAGENDEGAAFVFRGGPGGIASGGPANAATRLESNQAGSDFGISVAGAGDVDADGYADVLVGASAYDDGETDEGAFFLFRGGPQGIANGNPLTAAARVEADQAFASLGDSVAGVGDVDADGYADVIAGAFRYDAGEMDEGVALLFRGGPTGIASGGPAQADARIEGNQATAVLGESVAGAGDVDADGYADVIVGAFLYDHPERDEGAAFLFRGGPTGIASGGPDTAAARIESNQPDAWLGWAASGAGDVDADGYADVMIGAPLYDAGQSSEGLALLFRGGPDGIASGGPPRASVRFRIGQAGSELGRGVAGAGDVDADGYADVIAGAPFHDAGQSDEGAAFVWLGAPSFAQVPAAPAALLAIAAAAMALLARRPRVAGRRSRMLVALGLGIALLVRASGAHADGPAGADARFESNQVGAQLGFSVSGAGDVNGDGYADVLMGAYQFGAGQFHEGVAFLDLGPSPGVHTVPLSPAAWLALGAGLVAAAARRALAISQGSVRD